MGPAERVRELVEPLLASSGLELVDVELAGGILRLSLDRPGGIDLDAIAEVSPAISATLDQADPIPDPYQLEVSSPGLERPLRTPEHFRRFVGSKVSVRTRPGTDGERRVSGLLDHADDTGIEVRPEGSDQAPRRIAYADIDRARTVFEWGPAAKPGQVRRSRPAARPDPVHEVHEEATPR